MADLTGMMQAAAGSAAGGENLYIEDVFSTYLYDGTGSAQTITNGIDLDGEGGLVWIKPRPNTNNHRLHDTERGAGFVLSSNLTQASESLGNGVTSFNSDGFTLGTNSTYNGSGVTFASWTFRKAPKFFDIVTYTGVDAARTINHNLGVVPGCIIIKRTDITSDWSVYHRSSDAAPEDYFLKLQTTEAKEFTFLWNGTAPTDTQFSLAQSSAVNEDGGTYVAYLFAHDAGGFGDDGEQNVVSCGSFTQSSAVNVDVNIGYEPQWLLVKRTSGTSGTGKWVLLDNMRGFFAPSTSSRDLAANASDAEGTISIFLNNNGFRYPSTQFANSSTFVYIAIRRGPMKTPEAGTEVYNAIARTGTGSAATVTGVGFAPDSVWTQKRAGAVTLSNCLIDRLRGGVTNLSTTNANPEGAIGTSEFGTVQEGISVGGDNENNKSAFDYINWFFQRAPGFFDVVCWTGDDVAGRNVNHNLGVTPELIWVKRRNSPANHWYTYHTGMTGGVDALHSTARLNLTEAGFDTQTWKNYSFTSTTFSIDNGAATNASGGTYIAYLFATLAGISKVGSYTGTGTTLQVNCGFSAGARFVMIKRTDTTGDWYVWDSARGIIAGNDPYLLLNSTAVENTSTDYIAPLASGFEISSTAPAAINASGGNFIFLAIA